MCTEYLYWVVDILFKDSHVDFSSCVLALCCRKKIKPPPKNTAPPKSKPTPQAEEKKSESSTWKSYGFIALWFVLSIVGLVAGFYLEVYLVNRYEKPAADGDVMAEGDVVAEDIPPQEL
jgi:hypothetical protein